MEQNIQQMVDSIRTMLHEGQHDVVIFEMQDSLSSAITLATLAEVNRQEDYSLHLKPVVFVDNIHHYSWDRLMFLYKHFGIQLRNQYTTDIVDELNTLIQKISQYQIEPIGEAALSLVQSLSGHIRRAFLMTAAQYYDALYLPMLTLGSVTKAQEETLSTQLTIPVSTIREYLAQKI